MTGWQLPSLRLGPHRVGVQYCQLSEAFQRFVAAVKRLNAKA